jgi:SP family sugar:H+ symporter-like MFS transporter
LTAKDWIVFTVGRIIAYIGVSHLIELVTVAKVDDEVGLVENATPGYCSEVSPAPIRGFMSGSMTVLVTLGNTLGVAMTLPFVNETRSIGWMVSTFPMFGIQADN